ncbi:dolichyl-phosphate-mannose-protein mannosyltransferase [Saccharopolyspora erythraea NRRL 2338]|nr:glycosyltransferase family 39 protein [Saccharopolyspora erythraea]PFG97277.1 dolichyl-phosphate-mannose-protein mannosyltransferase [Saccharopolyspora erythraea NRRL 2338]QRK87472.1 glycosyltransferase family 39 protein [Saccharopolyspora erythraea]
MRPGARANVLPASPPSATTTAPPALLALGGIAAAWAGLLLVFAVTLEPHGDELYFLAAGDRLDWGYADQPPLLPLLAHAADVAAPGSVLVLRLPAVALTACGVFVVGMLARELGGGRKAQVVAAATFAVSPHLAVTGSLLVTPTVDAFMWAVLTLLLVRWVRLRDDRLLLGAGVVVAVALQAKYLVLVFCAAALISALLVGPRDIVRRPRLWAGAGLAFAALLPSALWQAWHGWPQLRMAAVVPAEIDQLGGGRASVVPLLLLTAGVPIGAGMACAGLWALLRSTALRDYRWLGWASAGVVVFFVVSGGRYYYCFGLLPLLWAVAAVRVEDGRPAARWLTGRPAWALSAAVVLVLAVAVQTPAMDRVRALANNSGGWRQVVEPVHHAYQHVAPEQRRTTVVVAEHYWQASVLERLWPGRDRPEVRSPHRGFWYFGPPSEQHDTTLFVGGDPGPLREHFRTVVPVAGDDPHDVRVWLCTGRQQPWSGLWPALRRL